MRLDSVAAKGTIEGHEEELENTGLAQFLQERLVTSEGERLGVGDFLAEIGMEEFMAQLAATG